MICYKGNSFFRIFKILIKDFVEKVKLSFVKGIYFKHKKNLHKKNKKCRYILSSQNIKFQRH